MIERYPCRPYMSNAWEYKEDDWYEHKNLKFSFRTIERFDTQKDKSILSKMRKKHAEGKLVKSGQSFPHIIPDWEYPGGKRKAIDPKNNEKMMTVSCYKTIILKPPRFSADSLGFSLDKKGYPIHNSLRHIPRDFPTPPESLEDVEKQVKKLNRDFYMDFPTWLGHHSREGWEIFKISRDFRDGSQEKRTWCVFRRKK